MTTASSVVSVIIDCWSLKPSTLHSFFIDGVPYSPSAHGTISMAVGSLSGLQVQTNSSGRVTFYVYPPAGQDSIKWMGTMSMFNLAAPGSQGSGRLNLTRLLVNGQEVVSDQIASSGATYL